LNHRIVSGLLAVVILAFAAAAILFALRAGPLEGTRVTTSGRPAPMPHERTGAYVRCLDCHAAGGSSRAVPSTHRAYAGQTCTLCHSPLER